MIPKKIINYRINIIVLNVKIKNYNHTNGLNNETNGIKTFYFQTHFL